MHQYTLYYLLVINAVTFLLYGIDKYKAKKNKWRISEATLLMIAVIGGSIGAWVGMHFGITRQCTRSASMAYQ